MTKTITAAVMFVDIADSSGLYQRLGDDRARELVSSCLAKISDQILAHDGTVIKTIGDEVMSRFSSADQACQTAVSIQRMSSYDDNALSVRIGVSYGKAILEKADLFGNVVNDAAAVTKIARASQIIATRMFCKKLTKSKDISIHRFDKINLKGSRKGSVIYRIDAYTDTSTDSATVLHHMDTDYSNAGGNTLHLTYGDKDYDLTAECAMFTIGRDGRKCDLGIESSSASRNHCHITYSRGKFLLTDHSSNGTFVQLGKGKTIYLRREELPLHGSGKISIGREIGSEKETLIHFHCA